MPRAQNGRPPPHVAPSADDGLGAVAADLYGDLRLAPLLRRLMRRSVRLLDVAAGSISLVDASLERYAKMAEHGAHCRLGQSFPLEEGLTGQVVAARRPVVVDRYGDVPGGHLPAGHPARAGSAAAVPLWWLGEVVGVNVVFAGRRRRFTTAEVDALELLTQVGAAGIVTAGTGDPSLAARLRGYGPQGTGGVGAVVTETGPARALSPAVAGAALDVVTLAERAAARRGPAERLRVALVYRPEGLRLLVHDSAAPARREAGADGADPRGPLGAGALGTDPLGADPLGTDPLGTDPLGTDPLGTGARSWQELVATAGGGISVEHVPGWGTLVRADLPYEPAAPPLDAPRFTTREREVLGLLARGLSDREVAASLVLSPRTVEKHVGAVLSKTATTSRTAAVVRALERGWLPRTAAGTG